VKLAHRFHHLARADFLERVRRHGFFVALLFCVYGGYAFLPANGSNYQTLSMDAHRGIYNSAWIGTAVAMLSAAFLSLIGFYIVKNAVERDRITGVGQILATTPISKLQYTLGKTLSNFAVLAAMTAIVALACVVMQFLRAEDRAFNAGQMFAPFVLITLPVLLITAGIAVFFETIPGLRGGIGNVAFVFLWGGLLSANFGHAATEVYNDPLGSGIVIPDMLRTCAAAFPDFDPAKAGVSMGVNVQDHAVPLKTFHWDGIAWTGQHVVWRLSWVLVGLAIGALAAIPFDRFDTARSSGLMRHKRERHVGRRRALKERATESLRATWGTAESAHVVSSGAGETLARTGRARLATMVIAEWKLIVRGLRWWWFGPLGLSIAALTAPLPTVKAIVLPIAWFWPVLLWSRLGTREATYNTEPIFFSAPRPLSRQLLATWLAGVMLSVVAAFAIALRFVIAGDAHALFAWCVGAAFAPALALAFGVWTRSGKMFEAIYTGLCYAVIQAAAPLDFMGAVEGAPESNPVIFAALTIGLLVVAVLGRRQRLQL
jgi:hypothetical protein